MNENVKLKAEALLARAGCVQITTVDTDGRPVTKAFLPPLDRDGLKTLWFSTNTSSRKVGRIEANSKACVYTCDPLTWEGLSLSGDIRVIHDAARKALLWRNGFEMYYPKGPEDPDYCLLCFVTRRSSYYNDLQDTVWEAEDPEFPRT